MVGNAAAPAAEWSRSDYADMVVLKEDGSCAVEHA
jgi:hypothetical protein